MDRNRTIDVAKGIAILMIIDVHLQSGAFFLVGETFHVVTFFVISGIIIGSDKKKYEKETIYSFAVKKIKSLIYPYSTMSILFILFMVFISLLKDNSLFSDRVSSAVIKTVSFQGVGTLWFLPVLFFAELIAFAYSKVFRRFGGIQWAICMGIIAVYISWIFEKCELPEGIKLMLSSSIAAGFIALGYDISPFFYKLSVKSRKHLFIVIVGSLSMFFLNKYFVRFYEADIHILKIGDPAIYFACSMSGVVFALALSCIFSYVKWLDSFFSFLGRNSLIIMTTHKEYYITYAVYLFLLKAFGDPCGQLLFGLLSLVLIVTIELTLILIVTKTPLRYLYKLPEINIKR